MEPEWTKAISNATVCNFYYAFFVFYAVVSILVVVSTITMLASVKLPMGMMVMSGIQSLLVFALATASALFHYLVCDRALKPAKTDAN